METQANESVGIRGWEEEGMSTRSGDGVSERKRHADRDDVGLEIQVWPRMKGSGLHALIVHSEIKILYINLQRADRESLALLRALVGQLDELDDGGGLFPFDSQLCSLSDTRGEILEQLDVRTTLVGWPPADANQPTLHRAERGETTCRLLAI